MSPRGHNLRVQPDDDAPPPPYSETDLFSNSGGGPRSPLTQTSSPSGITPLDDNASRISSSTGEIIYTPPLTPHTSPDARFDAQSQPRPQPAQVQSGATLFFESRPPPAPPSASTSRKSLTHTVKVDGTSLPDDLPYQDEWASHDVTPQDWATFVNFLLPDHTTRGNEAVIERKLRSEGRSDASSTSGRSQAEAQLEQIRDGQVGTGAMRSREEVEATIRQWNDGFFGPRGINVMLGPETGPRMPGAWDPDFENTNHQQPQQSRDRSLPAFGKLAINGNGIRYGDTVILDGNGLKISSLVMDGDGISFGRKDRPSGSTARCERRGPEETSGPTGPSWSFGGGSGWPHNRLHHQYGARDLHQPHSHGGRHSEDRGRACRADDTTKHNRSHSVSSNSSVFSSSSDSSIGSLPDYDDIKDSQLPLYAERLRDWVSHPDQVRTKSDVKQLKSDLKSAKNTPTGPAFDKRALKAQVKGLHTSWKQIRKSQRQNRKNFKRERRQQRRAERREHRNHKREIKRAHRDLRRGRAEPFGIPVPPPPPPGVPAAPPAPPAVPPPPPWGQPWSRGWCSGPQRNPGPCGPANPWRGLGGWAGGGPWGGRGCGGGGNSWGPRVPGGDPRNAPGAWPEVHGSRDNNGQESGIAAAPQHGPGAASAAKYEAVKHLERQINELVTKTAGAGADGNKKAMEKEIEALTDRLETVRMEADEAYARELAAEQF